LSSGDMIGSGVTNLDWSDANVQLSLQFMQTLSGSWGAVPLMVGLLAPLMGLISRVAEVSEACDHFAEYNEVAANNIVDSDHVAFRKTVVETPDNTRTLVRSLSLSIPEGSRKSLVVRGPSGAGKSSILKVLGGLWPCAGEIERPTRIGRGGILFLPQQNYTTIGTLRQQVTYPEDDQQYPEQGDKDAFITEVLGWCDLLYLAERWGLDKEVSWDEQLSGGEAQRLGFARLFYHRPKFAIMDESTSALDEFLQEKMLERCVGLDISMISVAHRPEVFLWHTDYLDLDGVGGTLTGKVPGSKAIDVGANLDM